MELGNLKDEKKKNHIIQNAIEDSIIIANETAESGEFFEAGELLFSVTELLESIAFFQSTKLNKLRKHR